MQDYELYYWGLPFRGNFIQLFLDEVRADYRKLDASEVYPDKNLIIQYPGMAPPYLYDCRAQVWFAQMPAILMHLAKAYHFLPDEPEQHTLALKVILDCNDILMEITNYNGTVMWDQDSWAELRTHRLADWMAIFEKIGQAHLLKPNAGYLLGSRLTVADIAKTGTDLFILLQSARPHWQQKTEPGQKSGARRFACDGPLLWPPLSVISAAATEKDSRPWRYK